MRGVICDNSYGLILFTNLTRRVEYHLHGCTTTSGDHPVFGTDSSTAATGLYLADDQVRFPTIGNGEYMFDLFSLFDLLEFKSSITSIRSTRNPQSSLNLAS